MKRRDFLGLMLTMTMTAGYFLRVTWHDDLVILSCMVGIGTALVALCYAIHKSPLGPLGTRAGCRIIDGGYWAGFALVVFCVFHGARPAAASAAVMPPAKPPVAAPAYTMPAPVQFKGGHSVPADGS